jgi:pyruvate/2-oxoglutarate dehydrogenase complex dihydrolipoamide dehydrogenase (E3) component
MHSQSQVTEILGTQNKATGIKLEDGKTLDADLVLIAMGYRPNGELAVKAGITVDEQDAIAVDNYLRTNIEDIFAVGDCAHTLGFITGRRSNIMLASTGAAEARILGYNLYSMRIKRNFSGTLSIFSTELSGETFASAGVFEPKAKAAGFEYVIGEFSDVDRHPKTLSGVSAVGIRLTVSPGDGQIIGGELFGGKSIGEMVNVLALAIQKNVTVYEFISLQLGTHPLLTAAPTKPILIKAAEHAIWQMRS